MIQGAGMMCRVKLGFDHDQGLAFSGFVFAFQKIVHCANLTDGWSWTSFGADARKQVGAIPAASLGRYRRSINSRRKVSTPASGADAEFVFSVGRQRKIARLANR
jgi:hypothetical protein